MNISCTAKILLILCIAAGCREYQPDCATAACYKLYYSGDKAALPWDSCQLIGFLSAPWEEQIHDNTRFKAFYNPASVVFRFQIEDSSITAVHSTDEKEVANGDRVELFFAADTSLREYYCIEISPKGNVLDYHASFYRKFDDSWNLNGLKVHTSNNETGYTATGIIPVEFFKQLSGDTSLTGKKIMFGIFRAEKKINTPGDAFRWYSWIKPDSEHPDFHIPSAFGTLSF